MTTEPCDRIVYARPTIAQRELLRGLLDDTVAPSDKPVFGTPFT